MANPEPWRDEIMKTLSKISLLIVASVLLVLTACEPQDLPDRIYDPDETGAPTPTITSMDPADQAYEGITTVTITGTNFAANTEYNQVTFNGQLASIDAGLSSTTQLVVDVPIVINDPDVNFLDSVKVIVAVQGAYAGALYDQNFTIKRAVINWGGFAGEVPAKEPNAVAVDADENVYAAASDGILYKISPEGERTEFGTGLPAITKDLLVAPGGYVLFVRNNKYVYRFDPTGGAAIRWLTVDGKLTCMDINAEGDLYTAGSSDSIFVADMTAETYVGVAAYVDYVINALRVYDGDLYVAAVYDGDDTPEVLSGIWKHAILDAAGNLGSAELVLDWADYFPDGDQAIRSMLISSEGTFYLGLTEKYAEDGISYAPGTAILRVDPATGSAESFYSTVLQAPGGHMKWGNGNYIYSARYIEDVETVAGAPEIIVQRIDQESSSAPYYGRN
jgi:hypothetical protein